MEIQEQRFSFEENLKGYLLPKIWEVEIVTLGYVVGLWGWFYRRWVWQLTMDFLVNLQKAYVSFDFPDLFRMTF